ncbi:MAG: PAS domain S-box protein, partial [Thermodesulfovibrionales bacterium]
MNKLLSMSIKSQLLVMVLIMAFFTAGIIIYSGASFRNEKIREAFKDSSMLADSLTNEHQKMVADARQLTLTLSQLSEIKGLNPAGMQQVLKKVLSVNPKYSNIFIADRAGNVLASAVPAKDTNVSDRRYFVNALASSRFSSGEYTISRFTGRSVLPFAYPFKDKGGEILGVIVMGIDLTYYRTLLDNFQLPSGSSYLLLDHKGTIMTRGINPADFVGEQYNPAAFKHMADGPDKGTFVAVAHDGTKRFISYRKIRLEGEQTPYMYVRSGIPVATALKVVNKTLTRNLVLFTASLCFVVVFILLIAKYSIIDRIVLLERASKHLADGDLQVKVSNLVSGGELGRLGLTFDHMANQIKLREEALRESEKRYYTFFEQSPDGILLIDTEGKMIEFNEMAYRQLGYSYEEFEKLGLTDINPFESPEEIRDAIGKVLKEGSAEFVVRHMTKQGEVRDVNIITKALDLSGRPVMYAIWHDITKRKRAEEALRTSEERLNTILDNVGAAIFIKDTNYRYTYVNRKVCEVFGRSAEEILGKSDKEFFSPGSVEEIMRSDRPVIERGETITREETEIMASDKMPHTYWTVKLPLRDSMGTVTGLCGISTDITERKQAEETKDRLLKAVSAATEGIAITDDKDRFIYVNDAHARIYGCLPDELIGKTWRDTVTPEVESLVERDFSKILHNRAVGIWSGESPALRKDGTILPTEVTATSRWDEKGNYLGHICIVRDISERKLLEEEQLKTQKLEAIGTLAGGIAHDFNNLLQAVFGYISMAKMTLDQKERSLTMLEEAEKALDISVNLTTQLLTFSKGGKPVKRKIQLKSVAETSARFALSGSSVDLRIKFDEDLWTVDADEGQIGQVIQNLVLNAEQAMPMGGTIVITARNVNAGKKELPTVLKPGNYVVISIKDSGIGIPEQYLPKIFDPYFTTKDKGSGLGLATSYSIIKNHGGLIDVKSKAGEGTIFFVYLPAVETMETSTVPVCNDVRSFRKGRILLMDDEDIVRNIGGDMLRSLGHEVESAED